MKFIKPAIGIFIIISIWIWWLLHFDFSADDPIKKYPGHFFQKKEINGAKITAGKNASRSVELYHIDSPLPSGAGFPLRSRYAVPSKAEEVSRLARLDGFGAAAFGGLRAGDHVLLPLLGGRQLEGIVNNTQNNGAGEIVVAGVIVGAGGGTFGFAVSGSSGAGRILPAAGRIAYLVETGSDGRIYLVEKLREHIVCEQMPSEGADQIRPSPLHAIAETGVIDRATQDVVPSLSSRPNSTAVIYLDFDGETVSDLNWNFGLSINAASSGLTNAEITKVWQDVAEHYRAFNVDVTTNLDRYTAAPVGSRMRCIITPTSDWYIRFHGSAGGVANIGSWRNAGSLSEFLSSTVPCWVFSDRVRGLHAIAAAISHEIGHTLGLSHDGLMDANGVKTDEYYWGHGTAPMSWAPVMGSGYNVNLVHWSKGDYADPAGTISPKDNIASTIHKYANNREDDLAIITSAGNHVDYAVDDAQDSNASAILINPVNSNGLGIDGIIERTDDADRYKFTTATGGISFHLERQDDGTPGAASLDLNLHADLTLFDAAGSPVSGVSSSPSGSRLPTISASVAAGTYYIRVRGVGEGSSLTSGYSSYGSIGSYRLVGTVAAYPGAPSNLVANSVTPAYINISWTDNSSDESGFKIERALGANGPWTTITTTAVNVVSYSDGGRSADTAYYYRVKAVSSAGESDPSNVASAKTASGVSVPRTLSLASSNPTSGAYIYLTTDANGLGDATTPATRSYAANKVVTVIASATAGGTAFQKWQRDGVDFSVSATTYVAMDTSHTMTAVYGSVAPTRTLASVAINGPDSLNENSSQTYTAMATFSDGSSVAVNPVWSLSQNGAPASVSQNGKLDVGAVSANTLAYLQASYASNGVTKTTIKTVTIVDTSASSVYSLNLGVTGLGHIGRIPNQNQFQAGSQVVLTAVPDTYYRFTGWSGDASGTTNPITVTMNSNKTITANFVYDAGYFGSVHVVIQPSGAAVGGAKWRLDFGPWQNSGDTVTPSSNGSHTVVFSNTTGYTTPAMQPINVVSGQTNEVVGNYVSQLGPGALQVTLLPQTAIDAGAQWRLQGGSGIWQNSGATLQGIAAGPYTLEFKSVTGWMLPTTQSVTITDGTTAVASAVYNPPAGMPVIYSVGPKIGPITGGTDVTIDGANFIAPVNVTFGGVSAPIVTVESSSRIIAKTPLSAAYRTVPIVVTAAGGNATLSNGFTYIVPRGDHMDLVSQIGGYAGTLTVQGNYLYTGEGAGLVIYDISNPGQPSVVGRLALPGMVRDIAVSGNYAYVADDFSGFFIVDVSAPTTPSVKGFYNTTGLAYGVTFQNGLAYVVGDAGLGLIIFDCTDPAAPTVRGSLAIGRSPRVALMSQGSSLYACLAGWFEKKIYTVDVTNAASPVLKSSFSVNGEAWDVAISGTKAYVTGYSGSDTVSIVELANPATPVLAGTYVNGWSSAIAVRNNIAYVGILGSLWTLSVSNASAPQFLGRSDSTGFYNKIALSGNYAYVAQGDGGLRVVSIASASSPTQVAKPPGLFYVQDVANNGTTLYAAGANSGFGVIDAGSPSNLRYTGRLDFSGYYCAAVANSGTNVFLGTQGGAGGAGVAAIRTDQSTPQLVSTYTQSSVPRRLFCDSALLYVADSNSSVVPNKARFLVLNYSNLSALSVQGQLTNSAADGTALRAISFGNRGYFSDAAGIHVVDLSQSSNPQRMGDISVSGNPPQGLAVAGSGKYLLVSGIDGNGGVQIYDVQNGNQPALVKSVLSGFTVNDIVVVGSLAYVAATFRGVYVLDIADVTNPVTRASYDTPGSANTLRVQGDLIYIADQSGGLITLRLLDYLAPTISITSPQLTVATTTSAVITVAGTAIDDKGVTSVKWANDRGGAGTAAGTTSWQVGNLPLQPGANVLTFTASDAAGNTSTAQVTVNFTPVDTTAPVIGINYPTTASSAITNNTTIELKGTATDNLGVATVSWINSRGGSGPATGTATWTAPGIPLLEGPNVITVTAADVSGNTKTASITITQVPPDTIPPGVVISFPTVNTSHVTMGSELNISGTAFDDRGVTKVSWKSDRTGGSGTAEGTTIWSANGITLQAGLNIITITVEDDAGNSSSDTLAVTYTPPATPTITAPPSNRTTVAGQNATFSVEATGTPSPAFQWQRSVDGGITWITLSNDGVYSGIASATLTINGASSGMTGDKFRVLVLNGVAPDNTSGSATLTVIVPPAIVTPPAGQTVNAGDNVTFTVFATGTAPLSYQWRKAGAGVNGATNAAFTLTNVQPADSGSYDVIVSNGVNPNATSNPAGLNVVPTGLLVTHSLVSTAPGTSGGTVTIENRFNYTGPITTLQWSVALPSGWSFASSDVTTATAKPVAGATSLIEWTWPTLPASPVTFNYTLNVPAGDFAPHAIAALVSFKYDGTSIQITAKPDPLMAGFAHSADTNHDFQISLFELTRVIELYNTRNGTSRTGAYKVDATGEDGFAPDAPRAAGSASTLVRYHSADTRGATSGSPRDGAIDLFELTRVIELFNTRSGTTRTGQYHVQSATEDGFAPGP